MPRREFPAKVKVAAYERSKGNCEGCGAMLFAGKFQYDHDKPDYFEGEPTLENCKVLCTNCHGEKTARNDMPKIAKSKRVRKKHLGIKKPNSGRGFPTNRDGRFKKKISGEVVER